MSLQAPKLDDRHFQDIVDEAKKRIPHYNQEWTDHNVSDPGVTLIELFAWMTDMILYRLNKVPERHYVKFMELLGIQLREPQPARAPITFWLTDPPEQRVVIPVGTEVATTQTETQESIIFTTDDDLLIDPPELTTVAPGIITEDGQIRLEYQVNLRHLTSDKGIEEGASIFSPIPQDGDALYFGFNNDLSDHILQFDLSFKEARGANIDPTLPPYRWEASTGQAHARWQKCDIEFDTTEGLNIPNGRIQIHLPQMGKQRLDFRPDPSKNNRIERQERYWIRLRIFDQVEIKAIEGMRTYTEPPILDRLQVTTWGGTTYATHAQEMKEEFIGRSDGSVGQTYTLRAQPILARRPHEYLEVHIDNQPPEQWHEVQDFADSDGTTKHYTLDSMTGEIRLGPAIQQPDGTVKLYGAIPPRKANLIFRRYRYGGGELGNVPAGNINTLKTAIPFVDRIRNRMDAKGGLNAERLEDAMLRTPKLLRTREHAVTASDFEFFATQALPTTVGRVKCLQPQPSQGGLVGDGTIFVLIIPRINKPNGRLTAEQLQLKADDITTIQTYLDDRRLLTTRVTVQEPQYHWVVVRAQLSAIPGTDTSPIEADALAYLYRYLNPITGGPEGTGWPFGRELFISDIYQCLQRVANVRFIRNIELYRATPDGHRQGNSVEMVEVVQHGVIASGNHEIRFV